MDFKLNTFVKASPLCFMLYAVIGWEIEGGNCEANSHGINKFAYNGEVNSRLLLRIRFAMIEGRIQFAKTVIILRAMH